mmetsp:Transcript_61792/g.172593  ORF Transcript_61792/g.172593 Transcript_61792/m.172593 type:complete len:279 (+) Transcript_61792:657-1493(+)
MAVLLPLARDPARCAQRSAATLFHQPQLPACHRRRCPCRLRLLKAVQVHALVASTIRFCSGSRSAPRGRGQPSRPARMVRRRRKKDSPTRSAFGGRGITTCQGRAGGRRNHPCAPHQFFPPSTCGQTSGKRGHLRAPLPCSPPRTCGRMSARCKAPRAAHPIAGAPRETVLAAFAAAEWCRALEAPRSWAVRKVMRARAQHAHRDLVGSSSSRRPKLGSPSGASTHSRRRPNRSSRLLRRDGRTPWTCSPLAMGAMASWPWCRIGIRGVDLLLRRIQV